MHVLLFQPCIRNLMQSAKTNIKHYPYGLHQMETGGMNLFPANIQMAFTQKVEVETSVKSHSSILLFKFLQCFLPNFYLFCLTCLCPRCPPDFVVLEEGNSHLTKEVSQTFCGADLSLTMALLLDKSSYQDLRNGEETRQNSVHQGRNMALHLKPFLSQR